MKGIKGQRSDEDKGIKRQQTGKANEKTTAKRYGKMVDVGGGLFGGERAQRRGGYATHNLALHLLSPPSVTRLKIKIKIK